MQPWSQMKNDSHLFCFASVIDGEISRIKPKRSNKTHNTENHM